MTAPFSHRPYCSVFLENANQSSEITVSPEGYQQLWALVQQVKICKNCKGSYSPTNPNVAGNWCLSCLLQQQASLEFQGRLYPDATESPDENPVYYYLDKQDQSVWTSQGGPGKHAEATKDIAQTLQYWGFVRPETAQQNGKTIELDAYDWIIFGDLQGAVVLLQWGGSWRKTEILFVAERGRKAVQLNRRSPLDRDLLAEARAEVRRRRPHGDINEADVYGLVAQQLSATRAGAAPPSHINNTRGHVPATEQQDPVQGTDTPVSLETESH